MGRKLEKQQRLSTFRKKVTGFKNMKKISTFLFYFLTSVFTYSQTQSHEIKFIVHSFGVNNAEAIFISGNDSLFGRWYPDLIRLLKINDSTWSRSFNFPKEKSLEYKFTKGSWELEALNDDGTTPSNSILRVTSDTTIVVNIKKWRNREPRIIHGQITGMVNYHNNFKGNGLKIRDIIVWLPPSYYSDSLIRYPVLYMHDGQNIFDPATSTFGYDWRVDEITDSLIKAGTINELIVVGIYNSPDRGREYSYSTLGYEYMNFIVSELKPFIDEKYRTMPNSENTAVAGSSAGGLISFMMAWCYPEVFSMAACFSSALKIRELNYVDTVLNYSGENKNIKLYIDNGGVGLETELQPGIDEMIVALQNKGYELGKDLIWYIDKNAIHSETAWAQRIWRPLVFFFGKK